MQNVQDPHCKRIEIRWEVGEGKPSLVAATALAMALGEKRERVRDILLAGMPPEARQLDWVGTVKAQAQGRRVAVVTIFAYSESGQDGDDLVKRVRGLAANEDVAGTVEIAA